MPPTKKKAQKKTSTSGADSASKAKVKNKMKKVMHEFKEGELQSGKSGKPVNDPKQAIAIGLSEARKSRAKIPPPPVQKKTAEKTRSSKKNTRT